jgi:hypothetical protein
MSAGKEYFQLREERLQSGGAALDFDGNKIENQIVSKRR